LVLVFAISGQYMVLGEALFTFNAFVRVQIANFELQMATMIGRYHGDNGNDFALSVPLNDVTITV
jgi:hypothetical protein